MNLTNYRKSELFKAYELVKLFADRYGVPVVGSEIVGLAPMDSLVDSAEFYLRLENFSREQVLERKLFAPRPSTLIDQSLALFSEEVASKKATPGGGSVSAYMAALAASLVSMVARITLGKKEAPPDAEKLNEVVKEGEALRQKLLHLVVEDAEAFDLVMKAFKLPKDQPEARKRATEEATIKASEIPLSTLDCSVRVLRLAREVAEKGSTNALSDVVTAVSAARAAVEGAASNVLINLASLDDQKYVEKIARQVSDLRKEAAQLEERAGKLVESRIKRPKIPA
jgi:glutamate formiminotransferase/formiminotetrahydrofolate cyclodeaminase